MAEKEYIEREAAINAFEYADYDVVAKYGDDGFSFDTVERIVRNIPAADVRPVLWTSVQDKLPETDGAYLVWMLWPCDEYPTISIVNYDSCAERFGDWHEYFDAHTLGSLGSEFKTIDNVYYWMPLPEPPKEET